MACRTSFPNVIWGEGSVAARHSYAANSPLVTMRRAIFAPKVMGG